MEPEYYIWHTKWFTYWIQIPEGGQRIFPSPKRPFFYSKGNGFFNLGKVAGM
jgi:hypothetical protein